MRRCWGVVLALVLVGSGGVAQARVTTQVAGGQPSTYPSVGALVRSGTGSLVPRQMCGAVLVAPTAVLTAAHCAQEFRGTGVVVLGRSDLDGTGGEEIPIKGATLYGGFDVNLRQGQAGDIALLELTRPSTQPVVPLMTTAAEPTYTGTAPQGTIVGWGSTVGTGDQRGPSASQRSAALAVFPAGDCQRTFGPVFDGSQMLCAGGPQASACNGDSGGPLLVTDAAGRTAVAGLSSFGNRDCGRSIYARVSAYADWITANLPKASTPTTTPTTAAKPGYSFLAADGTVWSYGSAVGKGSTAACKGPRSCTDIAGTVAGYWTSRATCDIAAFGVAAVAQPNTDERCTLAAASRGVWALTPSGRVFDLGGAPNYGSGPNRPRLAWQQIEARPQGDGYWLLGSDGAVAGFGKAKAAAASAGGQKLGPVVGMASAPNGTSYWLVDRNGAVATFGGAKFLGSTSGRKLSAPIIGIQATPTGAGYWLFGADGGVFAYGDARSLGGPVGKPGPMVAVIRR